MTSAPTTPATTSRRTDERVVAGFVVAAVVEAVTWAGLLVGMLLEHVLQVTDLGVWLFGRLHGAAFLAYCALALACWVRLRWSLATAVLAFVAAIPPFGTVVFERWARRTGRLDPVAPA